MFEAAPVAVSERGGDDVSGYLRVKNWDKFQHYKDRRPPWIKLHVELTDDYAFSDLSDVQKFHVIGIWLLAARTDNKIPNDSRWVTSRIGAHEPVDLDALVAAGFLTGWTRSEPKPKWGNRHVSKELRGEVLERDERKCRKCGAADNLEIDHIIPVSLGGESTPDNLQVLCRSCNRAKRTQHTVEQVATQTPDDDVATGSPRQRQRQNQEEETQELQDQVQPLAVPVASFARAPAGTTAVAAANGTAKPDLSISETIKASLASIRELPPEILEDAV